MNGGRSPPHPERGPSGDPSTRISVIIPILDETDLHPDTVQRLSTAHNMEVIIVEGRGTESKEGQAGPSSMDSIRARFSWQSRLEATMLTSPPGRARQMNLGALAARGGILLFLHADTCLPPGFDHVVREMLSHSTVVAGAFRLHIDSPRWVYRLLEWGINLRSQWFQLPYGDQCLFLRTETFRSLGGYPVLPILEDVELMRRLHACGRVDIAAESTTTSARRWERLGIVRTTWINQKILVGRLLGVPVDRLARWYNASSGSTGSASSNGCS